MKHNKLFLRGILTVIVAFGSLFYLGNIAFAGGGGLTSPNAPHNLSSPTLTDTTVNLAWDANGDGGSAITDYIIQYSLHNVNSWSTFADGTSTSTNATVTGLSVNTDYDFRVSAVNGVGTSFPSDLFEITTYANGGPFAPDVPRGLSVDGTTETTTTLSWHDPLRNGGSAITDYIVEYSLHNANAWSTFSDGTSTSTSTTVTGLTGSTDYDFRVSAVNGVGTGPATDPASGSTSSAGATITVDSNEDTEVSGDGKCTLREAISNANNHADTSGGDCVAATTGMTTVHFSEPMTIVLTSALPHFGSQIIVDGTANGNGTCTTKNLGIVIDGGGISNNIELNASNSIIRGLIIQNGNTGISVSGDNDQISCNIIGITQGDTLGGITQSAISLSGTGNIIGGATLGDGNIIATSNNSSAAEVVLNNATNTEIYGNTIGLNIAGNAGFGTGGQGILIALNSDGTIIGGSTMAKRNVISGIAADNNSLGLVIHAGTHNTTIQGNYFGTDVTGMIPIRNNNSDISVCSDDSCGSWGGGTVTDILIGGPNPREGNLFAGPDLNGADMSGPSINLGVELSTVTIQGNTFGVASDGVTAFPYSGGVQIDGGTSVTIGGATATERNVFTGNMSSAINIDGSDTVGIYGNYIGFLPDGITAAGSFSDQGISVYNSNHITIGGSVSGQRNVIGTGDADGGVVGITINQSNTVSVKGNYIGVGADGTTLHSGMSYGVISAGNPQGANIVFGGLGANEGNFIKDTTYAGIMHGVDYSTDVGNVIDSDGVGIEVFDTAILAGYDGNVSLLQNSIRAGTLGIDLAYDDDLDFHPESNLGENANDVGDSDVGPNGYLNHPTIISATQSGSDTVVTYGLDVPISAQPYHVEFFTNTTDGVSSSGFGAGETYIDSDEQTISETGFHIFTKTLVGVSPTDTITETVTECTNGGCTQFGGTSEFSNSVPNGVDMGTATGSETVLADGGAYHILSAEYLGSCVNADDLTHTDIAGPAGSYSGAGPCTNDKDGVIFDKASYLPGATITATVTASDDGFLNVFMDLNKDGSFGGVDEWLFHNQAVTAGVNTFILPVPAPANGKYNIRFRYTTYDPGDLGPKGEALDGEVEDYIITTATPSHGSSGFDTLHVNAVPQPNPVDVKNILGSGVCPANLIIHDFMKKGDKNGKYSIYNKKNTTEVGLLQQHTNRILAAQYSQAAGPVDGIFGELTKQGVMRLQTALNLVLNPQPLLKIDGIVGPFTKGAINNSCGGM